MHDQLEMKFESMLVYLTLKMQVTRPDWTRIIFLWELWLRQKIKYKQFWFDSLCLCSGVQNGVGAGGDWHCRPQGAPRQGTEGY